MLNLNPVKLIEEVKKRPGLYNPDQLNDREEKLMLWKEVGAAIFNNWDQFNKATAYDKVLQLQKKWKSLRDAYNREVRGRRTGVRINRRVYIYFKKMSFLGGFEGTVSEEEDNCVQIDNQSNSGEDPLINNVVITKRPKAKKRKIKKYSSDSNPPPEEMEMPVFPVEMAPENESDTDRLFLLSFLPEMRQLPSNIKMWARAQIANVMQEAVSCQYDNTRPGHSGEKRGLDVKRQRHDSIE